ncbi:hypothetical protein KOR34_25990 [Posidoniimonas corsicana]|uniref:Sulfatase n=1 Tax=Posidoniimonas corsicana TaxID=1938618 RepID=A0A5C5VI05_9BACT|nr:DUF1501 domain-containing protein [Posidoniimonas corsicana]TWT37643.1 hypothetical protein KOR34_25990 [Posidoniimonas corsicana]
MSHRPTAEQPAVSRRDFFSTCGMGMGGLMMNGMLAGNAAASADQLAARTPHFPGKAKHVIHLFMNGGPSHIDTFDPKPILEKFAGKPLPFKNLGTERPTGGALPSPFKFTRHGQSGIEVSELFPHVARSIDDISVVRSMHADVPNHEPSLLLMNCGDGRLIRPSVGSWVTYGLGSDNQNLPSFVALCPGYPIQESQNWQAGFLPGVYQATYVNTKHTRVERLVENIKNNRVARRDQRLQLDLLTSLNERHAESRQHDPQLEAQVRSFELAYRMQIEATDAFDVAREPQHILDMYGPGLQARQMLIARRLVERGVRFVQVWHGDGQPWDHHDDIAAGHRRLAQESDQAIGALLVDLKQRGLLDETLVLWGGEFGRTPVVELPKEGANQGKMNGRDHNHHGFTVWMAGGGTRGGYVHGATDECGFKAQEDRVHVHDLHATMLYCLGFDHERLTYRYAGRDFRLTDVHGRVVTELLA